MMRGLILVLSFHLGHVRTESDPWLAPDKAKHFFMAFFVQSGAFSGLRLVGVGRTGSLVAATAVASTVSVGKELYDRRYGGDPSLKDLAWDGAGIVSASVLLRNTQR